MKKLAIILITILTAAVLIAAGWWFGFQQRLLTEAYAVPTVDKHITDTTMTFSLLRQLDSSQIEDAKHMLRLRLDSDILTVDGLMDYTDARTRETARKIFTAIAEYRAAHPHSYTGSLAQTDAEVDAKIASILQKAKQEHTK
jgi:hypothetical protein